MATLSGAITISSRIKGNNEEINTQTINPITKLDVCNGNCIFLIMSVNSLPYQIIGEYIFSNNEYCSFVFRISSTIGKITDSSFTKLNVMTSYIFHAFFSYFFIITKGNLLLYI